MCEKNLEQFLCDFFKDDDFVEVNAVWLQHKLMDAIKNERLMMAQIREYKIQNDRLALKIESLKAEQIKNTIESDIRYRLNERV